MSWKEDKTLIVLVGGLVFETLMVLVVVYSKGNDSELYGLFAGILNQFAGALFMFLQGKKSGVVDPPPGSTTRVEQLIQTPPAPVLVKEETKDATN